MTRSLKLILGSLGVSFFLIGCSDIDFVPAEGLSSQGNKANCWYPQLDPDDPDYFEPIHDPDCYDPMVPFPDPDADPDAPAPGDDMNNDNNMNDGNDNGMNDDNNMNNGNDNNMNDGDLVKQPVPDNSGDAWLDTHCSKGGGMIAPLQISANASDVNLSSQRGRTLVSEARNLSAENMRGPLLVQKADRVTHLLDLRGGTAVFANHIDLVEFNRGPVDLSAQSVGSLMNLRGPLRVNAGKIDTIYDNRGPLCVSTHRLAEIDNSNGPIRIFGVSQNGERAKIDVIRNTRGPIFIYNADVGRIENANGPVFVHEGSVGETINRRGPPIR